MQVTRRAYLVAAIGLLARASSVLGQPKKQFRVSYLSLSNAATTRPALEALIAGLGEKGYRIGGNLVIEVRYANADVARLPALAEELVALKPDVIVGVEPAAIAIKSKTSTIPIVLIASNDPVASGLAKSLARPGTNVTGLANQLDQVVAKHIELLVEIAPAISRVALLSYRPVTMEFAKRYRGAAEAAAKAKNLTLTAAVAQDAETLRKAFTEFETAKVSALVVEPTSLALQDREAIIGHAMRLRLPSVTALPPAWSEAGGLLNYGANSLADFRYVASIVDRILKGANPAEMPIEMPSRFELIVNQKTARQLGLQIPQSILARADRVIADQ